MVKLVVQIRTIITVLNGHYLTLHASKKNNYSPSYAAEHPQFALHLILGGAPQWG